jgi:teichuronic acid biosynthesis glycosyltransferase TuaG
MASVSVIIPTYNRQDTLRRAIESVLIQTESVREILICDDGSTDHSEMIVKSIKDKRVCWLNCGRNGMPSIPRNMGIAAATGDWVAFLDSDDEWLPAKIEIQLKTLEQFKVKACSSNAFSVSDGVDNQRIFHPTDYEILNFEKLLLSNGNICSSVVVRRVLLEEVSNFPEEKELRGIEDYELWLRLSLVADFKYIHAPLVRYYDSPKTSIRSEIPLTTWQLRVIIFRSLSRWLQESDIKPTLHQRLAFLRSYMKALRKTGSSYAEIAREIILDPSRG